MKMLNVLMRDTVIPVHRHNVTNELVVVMRGKGYEATFDAHGHELERVMLETGSPCYGVMVSRGAWHTFVAKCIKKSVNCGLKE